MSDLVRLSCRPKLAFFLPAAALMIQMSSAVSPGRSKTFLPKDLPQELTYSKLCRKAGGDLEQIKFLLGHPYIQTTERYLGSEQDLAVAVNDNLGL